MSIHQRVELTQDREEISTKFPLVEDRSVESSAIDSQELYVAPRQPPLDIDPEKQDACVGWAPRADIEETQRRQLMLNGTIVLRDDFRSDRLLS
ncbi:MAG: hypothetical protein M3365_00025, partial [Gemmatimonadota bacterium]|nr:hypothetical protein [Gemmatimonadota bacterium]